ncbi:MAG: flagellar basal body rod protein FlgB [Planctomycetota bacterium]
MSMMGITDYGATGALEATIRFAGQRQRIIAHNIANISTPDFQSLDVSPIAFQKALSRAVDLRRKAGDSRGLDIPSTRELRKDSSGNLVLRPSTPSGNILGQDRNNSDIERLMQDQTENLMVYRSSIELLRSRSEMMRSALASRV